jgi:phosphoglycerate dehydrogenase-like enzyme
MKVGIVGAGSIGSEVARLAEAFGMQPIGLRRTPRGDEGYEVWPTERLHDLLDWADTIVVAAPLTDETRGMFGADEFARMKPGAWFVNVGRGAICDEDALIAALVDGHLGGAGLDVFTVEPLPADSPLWVLPNVVMTPHCSGDSITSDRRAVDIIIDNFRRRTAGEPLRNVVSAS